MPILKKSLQVLTYTGIGGQALVTAASAISVVDQLPMYLEQLGLSVRSNMEALDDSLQYAPLGWYMLITHYRPPGTGQKNQWYVSYMEAAEESPRPSERLGNRSSPKGIQTAVNDDEVTLECELQKDTPFDGVPKVHITTHLVVVTDVQIEPAMIK
ncbi:hypothetical protein Bbelb_259190, partial [Branchiostoma belcheri]